MSSQPAGDQPFVDNKVLPVMREAVITVQMVLFKVLRQSVQQRYGAETDRYHNSLAGAVLNNLFGTQPLDPEVQAFAVRHRELVEEELRALGRHCAELCPILTDALRMQTICDNQVGIHSIPSLLMAKALGLLQEERELPLPSTFMLQVRALAAAHGLIEPMPPQESPTSH